MNGPTDEEGTATEGERHRRTENTEAVGGAIGGMTGGGVAGGLAMGALGPLGGVLAALAGYVGGWWAGSAVVEATEELDDVDDRLRSLHEKGPGEHPWEETRHAYQLGYLAGRNPRWGASDFGAVEEDLRKAWTDAHDDEAVLPWKAVQGAARRGWELGRERARDV